MASASRPSRLRFAVWGLHIALPLLGLWLLIAQPGIDVVWEDHLSHFVLVLAVAAVNIGLGARMSEVSRQRADARLFLVSIAFLSSAGFLLLHALATPKVLLTGSNSGFVLASPVGLLIASVFAAASAADLPPDRAARVLRRQGALRGGIALLLLAWGTVSLLGLPPLDSPIDSTVARGGLVIMTVVAVGLYGYASLRYFQRYRGRPAVVLLSVITAFALLAEAMIAVTYSRSWHVSWWEWHLLMLLGFGFVAYSSHVQYRREGSPSTLFNSISLEETLKRIRDEHTEALEALVDALERHREGSGDGEFGAVTARLGDRFGLTEGQVDVLERSAEALAAERSQILRLGALVSVGNETRVLVEDRELLRRVVEITGRAFRPDAVRVGLVEDGLLHFPPDLESGSAQGRPPARSPEAEPNESEESEPLRVALESLEPVEDGGIGARRLILPLVVKGRAAGILEVRRMDAREFAQRDRSVLESLASQLSIAVENARLYRQIDTLFRSYMSPEVATTLLADPAQAALGGAIVEVTVLFADLQGFTPFSERSSPEAVVEMLNRYFGAAVPRILEHGGTVIQFIGDAVMAIFNAPARQPDHALRAARAGLAMQEAIEEIASGRPEWPRFRVGINTGPALVGNVGSPEMRNFTAIGDTTNLAARLEASAGAGQVVIGEATYAQIGGRARVRSLGELRVKGKSDPVAAYILEGLRD
ncbi:hypothetical protein BH20ACT24_BH20ACT24_20470 [soil metagenome]